MFGIFKVRAASHTFSKYHSRPETQTSSRLLIYGQATLRRSLSKYFEVSSRLQAIHLQPLRMQLPLILASLLATLPATHSAPVSAVTHYDEPPMCGYVLTVRNSSAYAGISAYSSCTAIYYNSSIPGYQQAYAYSVFGGCGCSFHV